MGLLQIFIKKKIKQVSALKSCKLAFNLVAIRLSDHVRINIAYTEILLNDFIQDLVS